MAKEIMQVLAICGWSNSGKTSLIERLLPVFATRKIRVSVLKHSHHLLNFEPAHKDSARLRQAGAQEVGIVSPTSMAILQNYTPDLEPTWQTLVQRLQSCDLVLLESYKNAEVAKLEVFRASLHRPLLALEDVQIRAVCSFEPLPAAMVGQLDWWDVEALADWILQHAIPFSSCIK
jgi:molybdopterin-guanine dinucleotide biosynthesis protein B